MGDDLQTVHMSDGCGIKLKILGDGPGKPLMIANHGAPGLSTHKEPAVQFGVFADVFRVLVFDMRGSGKSDKKRPFTHARWAEDVEEIRKWAGDEKFLMIGCSHGGFLTLEYIVRYPQHLYGAVIGDAAAQLNHYGLASAAISAMSDPRITVHDPQLLLRTITGTSRDWEDYQAGMGMLMPLYVGSGEPEVDPLAMLQEATDPHYETANAAVGYELSRYDLRDRLPDVSIPVFIYTGRHDWVAPPKLSEDMHEWLKGSKLVIYEKSGHFCALEEKTKFVKDAREFFATLAIPGLKI